MRLYAAGRHGTLGSSDLATLRTLNNLHALTQRLPRNLALAAPAEAPGPLCLGDHMGYFLDMLNGGEALRERCKGPDMEEALGEALAAAASSGSGSSAGAATFAAAGAWAAQSVAATAAQCERLAGELAALSRARTPAQRSAAAPWFDIPPEEARFMEEEQQPFTPLPEDAAHLLQCQLGYPKAALEALCTQFAEASGSFSRAEAKLGLGRGRCTAALDAFEAALRVVEAAEGAGALPSLVDRGRVEAALVEGDALAPRLQQLLADGENETFGAGGGGGGGEEEEEEEGEEPELPVEDGEEEDLHLPVRLARALTVLGSPPDATTGPSPTARPALPAPLRAALAPTVASFQALLAGGATGGRARDVAEAAEGWAAVARAYAGSGDGELRVRAACYYDALQVARICEEQQGLSAEGSLHGHLSHTARLREGIRSGSSVSTPCVLPFGAFAALVTEM